MLMGAPDLSFTQFMVETLSVVILALAMTRLRLSPQDHRSATQTVLDGTIALATGGALTLVMLRVLEVDFDMALTDFFNEYSLQIAHGRNIVNVILVDFRGIDTFGEIAVVMTSGLAILALIRVLPKRSRSALTEPPAPPPASARTAEAIHADVREAK
jgi:multicomponent Na+:H+ antiporter subunit A